MESTRGDHHVVANRAEHEAPAPSPADDGGHLAHILASRPDPSGAHRLELLLPPGFRHRPGQVVEVSIGPGAEGYFAIASPPAEAPVLTLLVGRGGTISAPLVALPAGAELKVRGPFGLGYDLPERPGPVLLVGVGSAIGALRAALIEVLARGHGPVTLLLGVRTASEVAFADELAGLAARGARVLIAESQAPSGAELPGRVQRHLAPLAADHRGGLVLLAGSEELEDDVTRRLVALGFPLGNIQRNFRPDQRQG